MENPLEQHIKELERDFVHDRIGPLREKFLLCKVVHRFQEPIFVADSLTEVL